MADFLTIFQSRNPGIWTSVIPGFGTEKMGRDPGIRDPGIAIPNHGRQFLRTFTSISADLHPREDDAALKTAQQTLIRRLQDFMSSQLVR